MTAEHEKAASEEGNGDFEYDYWRSAPQLTQELEGLQPGRLTDDQFRLLAENIPTLCWMANGDGYIVWFNRRWHEYCGTTPEQMVGWGWQSVHHPDILPAVMEKWTASIATGEPFEMTFPLRGGDGVFRPFLTRVQPVCDATGKVARWFGVNTEITAQVAAEEAVRESEARFREMADSAPAPVWVTNEQGIEFVNNAYVEMAGIPAEALTGDIWTKLIHPDDLPAVAEARAEAWAARKEYVYDGRFRNSEGEWRWLRVSSRPRFNAASALIGYVGMAIDITDAKRAEAELRESEARFRRIADSAPVLMWVTRPDRKREFVNQAYVDFLGVPREAAADFDWRTILHPEDAQRVRAESVAGEASLQPFTLEGRYRRHDGEYRWMRSVSQPRFGADDAQVGFIGFAYDVTEAKEAEVALREGERRFRTVFENAAIGMLEIDADWHIQGANAAFSEISGYSLEELVGANSLAFTHPDDVARSEEALREVARRDSTRTSFEKRYIRKDGGIIWIRSNLARVSGEGRSARFLKIVEEVTDRRAAENALHQESRTLETLNRTGAAIAGELDLEKVVQLVTDAGVDLSGAAFGAFFYNVLNEAGESYMLYALSGVDRSHFAEFPMPRNTAVFGPTFAGERVVRSDDITKDARYGKNKPYRGMPEGHLPVRSYLAVPVISRSGEVVGGLFFGHPEPGRFTERHEKLMTGIAAQAAIAIDNARLYQSAQTELSERMRAESELRELNETLEQRVSDEIERRAEAEDALRQSQKMETVGQLTGGIAHDFNNLLQIVTGNLDILLRNLPAESPRLKRAADNAMTGARRAALLTERLLAFSRRQPLSPKPIDVNKLVAAMSELLHRTLGEMIEIEAVLSPRLWRVEADPNQLENALLNLAVNARDAMSDGGKLTIETQNTHLDESYVAQNAEVSPGQYVLLCVSDTGIGMDQDAVSRAFEPFFTTKEVGRGTGLGLSMVYGFVKQSGGHVKIYSEPGQGTTVRIYLPRLVGAVRDEEEVSAAVVPEGTRLETILVCEDDDDVRAYSVDVLRELGYQVIEAPDGPSALRLLELHRGGVDLLFTDIVLPGGMTGAVLADRARAVRPDLKVLFTTGYARNAIVHQGRLDPGVELITKPFAYSDLAARIRDILDRD